MSDAADAVDVAAGVTQPGAQLCSQGLCEGELTLGKTNRASGDLNKRKKKIIRSQSYPTNHCVTSVHKPPFSSSLRPTCSCWASYSDTREFIWATFLLCSLQSFIFCFTERDSLCLHLIYTIVGIFLFCDNRKVPSILSPAFRWLWLKVQEDVEVDESLSKKKKKLKESTRSRPLCYTLNLPVMYVKWFKQTNKQTNPITGYCNRLVCTTILTSPNLSPHRYLFLPVHWFIWRIETNHFWLVCVCRGIIQYPGLALYTFKLNWLQMMQAGLVINAANIVQMDNQEKWLQLNGTASCYKWCSRDVWARDQCIRSNTVEACRTNSYLHLYICFVAIFVDKCLKASWQ